MREILFRGKRKDTDKWVYGHLHKMDGYGTGYTEYGIQVQDTSTSRPWSVLVIPETVGQYTGLTDKNGNKIFEGDICQTKGYPLIDEKPFVIEWNSDECSFYWRDAEGTDEFTIGCSQCTTVIGNIHDNPELLKGE